MKRFEKFLNRGFLEQFLAEEEKIEYLGIEKRYIPDEIDIFDELEFGLGLWEENQLVFVVVLENGKLGRISLGYVPPEGDEDNLMAFKPDQLETVLNQHGPKIMSFLDELFPED